jgi:hypothetical protein
VTFTVPITSSFSVGTSKFLSVRVVSPTRAVRFAYDTNAYPADVTLPITQGCPC